MAEPDVATKTLLDQARQLARERAEELGIPAPDPDREIVVLVDEAPQIFGQAAAAGRPPAS